MRIEVPLVARATKEKEYEELLEKEVCLPREVQEESDLTEREEA